MEQQRARAGMAGALGIVMAVVLALAPAAPPAATAGEDGGKDTRRDIGPVTQLPLPRYVSLGSHKINVRRGPGLDYRKDWVFRREGLPVRIVDEYGNWRRIIDKDEAGGWVYHAMLSGRRTVLVVEDEATLRRKPSVDAPALARAEQGVIAAVDSCTLDWCRVEASGYEGWVRKSALWGVDPGEIVED